MKQYLRLCVGRERKKFSTFDKIIENFGLMQDSDMWVETYEKRQSICSLGSTEDLLLLFGNSKICNERCNFNAILKHEVQFYFDRSVPVCFIMLINSAVFFAKRSRFWLLKISCNTRINFYE